MLVQFFCQDKVMLLYVIKLKAGFFSFKNFQQIFFE